jgi:hypothetical protein
MLAARHVVDVEKVCGGREECEAMKKYAVGKVCGGREEFEAMRCKRFNSWDDSK